jgi:hypothetical protein
MEWKYGMKGRKETGRTLSGGPAATLLQQSEKIYLPRVRRVWDHVSSLPWPERGMILHYIFTKIQDFITLFYK